ncbi:WD40 repeat domain-containing protein [Streptomyces sp. NPDC059567]|uniref:WD40 repeat domain-containing protein n=1 Tax=Streptomyces sp. NPDC059567 TaxID=3346867 RepID=UPI0036C5D484
MRRPRSSRSADPEQEITSLTYSPDGHKIAAGTRQITVHLWTSADFAPNPVAEQLETGEYNAGAVAFSPDGKTLVSASNDRTVRLWDTTTQRVRATLTVPKAPLIRDHAKVYVSVLTFNHTGTLLATAGGATRPGAPGRRRLAGSDTALARPGPAP